jgi:hypothetical protein
MDSECPKLTFVSECHTQSLLEEASVDGADQELIGNVRGTHL